MECAKRLVLSFLSSVLFLACQPSEPVTVRPVDMQLDVAIDMALPDQAVDMTIDMDVVDMAVVDASLPEYVETLEPNIKPDTDKIFVTGQRDQFYFSWWRGGRLWTRNTLVDVAPSPVDENVDLVVMEHSEPIMRRYIPPFVGSAHVLRPAGWPDSEAGYLITGDTEEWHSYDLSSNQMPTTLAFEAGYLETADRTFGPTSPSEALLMGRIGDRVYAGGPQAGVSPQPVGERNTDMPISVSPMGHLWLLAYADGHCTTFTADGGIDREVGNWRCFSTANTQVLGRDAFSSDEQGPVMVQHDANMLKVWDPRPGLVTNPSLVTLPSLSGDSLDRSEGLPEDWTLHESLGHQVLTTGEAQLHFVARFGDTLAFAASTLPMDTEPTLENEDETETSTETETGTETDTDTDTDTDTNNGDGMGEGGSGEPAEEPSDDAESGTETNTDSASQDAARYWVLVSRDAIVVLDRADIALGAFLVLDGEPVHLIWDGVLGELKAVPLTVYTRIPLLSVRPESCPGRSAETCGPADADCDGEQASGVCCPFVYAHSEVSTLNDPGAFEGDWYISKTDLGALLAAHRKDRIEFHHLNNESSSCFACATGIGPIKSFAHSDAVVAVSAQRISTEETCPETCGVSVATPEPQVDVQDMDMMEPGSDAGADLIMVHPTAGQLVFREPGCDVQFLESISSGISVALVALCTDRALVYEVMNGVLSETPLTVDLGASPIVWVGPQIKHIIGGRYVVEWLTAHGESFTLKAWRFGIEGLVELPVPQTLTSLTVEQRALPIRVPISPDGLMIRKNSANMQLEYLSETTWRTVPSHLWARDIKFSKYEDFAVTLAELRDPSTPGFDPIEQTLGVYGHDLKGIDSPWGQEFELESSPILGYSFQGVVIPEWDHYSLEPDIWWAVGRDTLPPTIKRMGIHCHSTPRLQEQKVSSP